MVRKKFDKTYVVSKQGTTYVSCYCLVKFFKQGTTYVSCFCLVIFTHLDWITFYNYFFKTYPLAGLYHGALTRLWFKTNLIVYVKLLSLIVITQF